MMPNLYDNIYYGIYSHFKTKKEKFDIIPQLSTILWITILLLFDIDKLIRIIIVNVDFNYSQFHFFLLGLLIFLFQIIILYRFNYLVKIQKKYANVSRRTILISYIISGIFVFGSLILMIFHF